MIVKKKDGYHVVSEKGKNLGGPYTTKAQAVKRLKQVEHFKDKNRHCLGNSLTHFHARIFKPGTALRGHEL